MATFTEIVDLYQSAEWDALKNKISVACIVKAHAITELASPTDTQKAWATLALANPTGIAQDVIHYVIAANASASVAGITGASDAVIQGNVDDAVDNLYGV